MAVNYLDQNVDHELLAMGFGHRHLIIYFPFSLLKHFETQDTVQGQIQRF